MSGIDPGRPKIEEREAGFIASGTRILLDSGVEWWVTHVVEQEGTDYLTLGLARPNGKGIILSGRDCHVTEPIRCRVEDHDR